MPCVPLHAATCWSHTTQHNTHNIHTRVAPTTAGTLVATEPVRSQPYSDGERRAVTIWSDHMATVMGSAPAQDAVIQYRTSGAP